MRGVTPALAAFARRFRLPRLPRNEAAPLGLLLLALASVFAFGGDRSQFYRWSHHNQTSVTGLQNSANLSAEHWFLQFRTAKRDGRGETEYDPYNRFPIGSHALIKTAMLPAGDDIPKQILAARTLMLAFFAAAAVLAYLALARLLGDRRIALAATLLAFSSYYLLHYADMISAETSTNLFGVMLVFHGMVLLVQEGRFRQLLPKTAIAILLGWHVLGLIAPFVLLALGRELLASRADGGGARPEDERRLRPRAILAYGAFSALCAALALGFNFGNEYRALGGEVPLHELPSFRSMLRRGGLDAAQEHVGALGWATFLRGQFGGIGGMAIPYAAADRLGLDLMQRGSIWPPPAVAPRLAVLGAAAVFACAAGLRWLPQRTLFAALLLTGWCWIVPFRGNTAFHEFEAMFHVGAPLAFWSLILLGLRGLARRERAARALPAAALAAAAVFALSAAAMGRVGQGPAAAAVERETTADFGAMRPFAAGRTVLFEPALRHPAARRAYIRYWLYGSYPEPSPIGTAEEWAGASRRHDYVVAPADLGGSLTPGNRRYHLYRPAALAAAWDAIAAREPDARSEFEVRLDGRTLTWTRDDCAEHDVRPALFVHAVPLDAGDPPPDREYFLDYRGLRFGGRCIARIELPDYPLAGLRTGQRQGYLPPLWEVSLPVGDASFPRYASTWRETATAGEPAARGPFDVYRDGRTLTWVREDCTADDTEDRFFVHVYDFGGARERLDFRFGDRGARWGGACVAAVELPDYEVRSVRTGQYDESGEVWASEFPLDPEAWLARFASFAEREPALRGPFDVHRDGRALTWVREDCEAEDTEDRFFVHVHDAEGTREGLDFWFRERGVRYGGVCMATAGLPDYEVRSVRTGQYDETGHLWDEEFALDAGAWLARFEAAAAREPTLRARGFGLHLDGRALTFVREACGAEDIADRFFVHVHPADGGARENLDFWFRERGLRHGDRCMATVALPEYAVARIVTGQYDASGHLWEAELAIGEASR